MKFGELSATSFTLRIKLHDANIFVVGKFDRLVFNNKNNNNNNKTIGEGVTLTIIPNKKGNSS